MLSQNIISQIIKLICDCINIYFRCIDFMLQCFQSKLSYISKLDISVAQFELMLRISLALSFEKFYIIDSD